MLLSENSRVRRVGCVIDGDRAALHHMTPTLPSAANSYLRWRKNLTQTHIYTCCVYQLPIHHSPRPPSLLYLFQHLELCTTNPPSECSFWLQPPGSHDTPLPADGLCFNPSFGKTIFAEHRGVMWFGLWALSRGENTNLHAARRTLNVALNHLSGI